MTALPKYESIIANKVADVLSQDTITQLAKGELMAIHVPNYYPKNIAEKVYQRVYQSGVRYYLNAPNIGRVGMAFYETDLEPKLVSEYYRTAVQNIAICRRLFEPNLSPIDKIRLELQEVWGPGANIENIHERKMFVGLLREMEPGVTFLAHRDDLRVDTDYHPKAMEIQAQIAANVYLRMPELDGGSLELWDLILTEENFNSLREVGSYGITHDKLPAPSCVITPKVGDLILFNARRIHAVSKSQSGHRLSISCFIAYRGCNQPLTYWS